MPRRLVDEERGLAPDVESTNHLDPVAAPQAALMAAAALLASHGLGEIPFDLEGTAVADAFETADLDPLRHIKIHFHRGHRRLPPWNAKI